MSEILGRGAVGLTYRRKNMMTDAKVIVKEVDLERFFDDIKEKIFHDLEICRDPDHWHIHVLNVFDFVFQKQILSISMEENGPNNLGILIEKHKRNFNYFEENLVVQYLFQIASALAHIHQHLKMVHGDLKPTNILIAKDGNLKVSDVGLGVLFTDERAPNKGIMASPYCCAPEVMNKQIYTGKSDVWSVGIIAHELAELDMPCTRYIPGTLLYDCSLKASVPLMCNRNSAQLRQFIISMLDNNYVTRPSSQELLENGVFQEHYNPTLREPAKHRLVVISCRWSKPLRTVWFHSVKKKWMEDIKNVLDNEDDEDPEELVVDYTSCVISLPDNEAVVVDSMNRTAYKTDDVFTGVWRKIEGPKLKRSYAIGVAKDQKLFLIGGCSKSREIVNTVEILDLENEEWSQGAQLPKPLYLPAAIVVANELIVFGGKTTDGSSQGRVQKLSPEGAWKESKQLIKDNEYQISGCEYRRQAVVCLSSRLYTLARDQQGYQLDEFGKSPGNSDSMVMWRGQFIIVRGHRVWHLNPGNGQLIQLPLLPVDKDYTRSFATLADGK